MMQSYWGFYFRRHYLLSKKIENFSQSIIFKKCHFATRYAILHKKMEKRRKRRKHREKSQSREQTYRCPETGETLTRPTAVGNGNEDSDSEGDFEHFLTKESRNTQDIVKQKWAYESELSEMSDFVVSESGPLIYDTEEEGLGTHNPASEPK